MFLSLCYHYIRTAESHSNIPRIIGNHLADFEDHVRHIGKSYKFISLNDVDEYLAFDSAGQGVLLTFDDGLSDHYHVARVLAEKGLSAAFFIPTCILHEKLPANPIIIHYGIALFGITAFLKFYMAGLEELKLDAAAYGVFYEEGDDPFAVIRRIKEQCKYKLSYHSSRELLIFIYQKLFANYDGDVLSMMHLTEKQITEMIAMGHCIGTHSHTHISVLSASDLTEEEISKELVWPKKYLQETFGATVDSLSYPFGEEPDCLSAERLLEKTHEYKYAFTINPILNDRHIHPYELGRYMVTGRDSVVSLLARLEDMSQAKGVLQ